METGNSIPEIAMAESAFAHILEWYQRELYNTAISILDCVHAQNGGTENLLLYLIRAC